MWSFEEKEKKKPCQIQIYFRSYKQMGSGVGTVHPGAVANSDTPNIGEASNSGI